MADLKEIQTLKESPDLEKSEKEKEKKTKKDKKSRKRSRSGEKSKRRSYSRDRDDRRKRSYSRDRDSRRRRSYSRDRDSRRRRSYSRDRDDGKSKSSKKSSESQEKTIQPPISNEITLTQVMKMNPLSSLQECVGKLALLKQQQTLLGPMGANSGLPNTPNGTTNAGPVELYVANVPPTVTGPQLKVFLGSAMEAAKRVLTGPGNPITACNMAEEQPLAFLEIRSEVEAANTLELLDGIIMHDHLLKMGRVSLPPPPQLMPPSIPTIPGVPPPPQLPTAGGVASTGLESLTAAKNAALLAAQRLNLPGLPSGAPVATPGQALANPSASASGSPYLMCMNAPIYFGEVEVKRLLSPFGKLKAFNLLKDGTGKSKGTFVFEYEDNDVTSGALQSLNGLALGLVKLSVQRVAVDIATTLLKSKPPPPPSSSEVPLDGSGEDHSVIQAEPTCVLKLDSMITEQELQDPNEVNEIKDDVTDEAKRFGVVQSVVIPALGEAGCGSVFVEFADVPTATRAHKVMHGREFGDQKVVATFFPLERFQICDFGPCLFENPNPPPPPPPPVVPSIVSPPQVDIDEAPPPEPPSVDLD